ncbi:MAG: OmcA/MtrC family decaheme c-type cytochrome [Gammaproteobacteria bacterium]
MLPDVTEATTINAGITGVTIASPPVVQFSLTDERGQGLTGLQPGSIRFTLARLEDGTNGNPSSWQSYVNRVETAGSAGPGTEDKAQATTETATAGTLVDNGDGTYEYTFAVDVANVTDPVAVAYDATLTHRVGFEIRGLTEVKSPSYTFRPSDGATTGIFSRQMINDDSCNACHQNLALHGGARFTNDYCVTCHNPGSEDANSGNTVDMTQMIHKIHQGANLPSIAGATADARYSIFGFRDSEHIYADNTAGDVTGVIFPQDVRNCRNCHDENDASTPDAGNWISKPTIEACGACHDNVNFATGENHFQSAPPVTNAECVNCHGAGEFAAADQVHRLVAQEESAKFQFNIVGAVDTAPGQMPTVTFSITDPTNGDAPYDIANDDPFIQGGGASRIAVLIGWNSIDYTNTGSGSEVPGFRPGSPAQVVSMDPLGGNATDNNDGTFSITSTVAVPADVTGSLAVAIEGHPAVDINGSVERIPVTGTVAYFGVTDATPVARRDVVDIDTCNNCHQSLSLHGNNRTDSIPLCVTCHNANATDIRARMEAGVDENTSADGKKEETIDFKQMVHAIHAGNTVLYGFGGGLHDYTHVVFPAEKNTCTNCHDGDTFYPVNQNFVLATTIDSGADLGDPTDDVNISPTAAACYGCHQSDGAQSHMVLNGASFNASQAADGTITDNDTLGTVVESCEVCHGEGRSSDVGVVHGVN